MAAGHEGIGITEAPITGLLISQMLTGAPVAVAVDVFSPAALYDALRFVARSDLAEE